MTCQTFRRHDNPRAAADGLCADCGRYEHEHVAPDDHLGWWCIHGGDLLNYMRRCHNGEDPDVVYAEAYANSDHEYPAEEG